MALPSSTSAVLGRLLGFVGVYIEKKVMYKKRFHSDTMSDHSGPVDPCNYFKNKYSY